MKDVLDFLIQKITGSDKFTIEERYDGPNVELIVQADPEIVGLIIGREGKTIKTLRKIIAIKAVSEHVSVNISVNS